MDRLGKRLLDAAFMGQVEVVRGLLDKGASVHYPDEELGDRPLHRAAMEGHVEVARLLLERGADVNAAASFGERPLHWAADSGHLGMIRFLVENGAQVNAMDSSNTTAAHWASRSEQADAAALLGRLEKIKRARTQRTR